MTEKQSLAEKIWPYIGGKSSTLSVFYFALMLLVLLIIVPTVFFEYYAYGPFSQFSSYFHVMFFTFLAILGFFTLAIFKINRKIGVLATIILWLALVTGSVGAIIAFYNDKNLMFSTNSGEILFIIGFVLFALAALLLIVGLIHREYKGRFTQPTILLVFLIFSMFLMAYNGLVFGDNATGGAHSHSITSLILVAIVAITMQKFGFNDMKGKLRAVGIIGLVVMYAGIVTALYLYTLASIFGTVALGANGYPGPPVLFAFGPGGANGIAMDDMATFIAGIGASFIAFALIYHQKKIGNYSSVAQMFKKDSARFALPFAFIWTVIGLVIPGFSIELNESFYQNAGLSIDQAFAHWHLMFLFSMIFITLMYLNYAIIKPRGKFLGISLSKSAEIANKLMFAGYITTPFLIYPYAFTLNSALIYITAIPIVLVVLGVILSSLSILLSPSSGFRKERAELPEKMLHANDSP